MTDLLARFDAACVTGSSAALEQAWTANEIFAEEAASQKFDDPEAAYFLCLHTLYERNEKYFPAEKTLIDRARVGKMYPRDFYRIYLKKLEPSFSQLRACVTNDVMEWAISASRYAGEFPTVREIREHTSGHIDATPEELLCKLGAVIRKVMEHPKIDPWIKNLCEPLKLIGSGPKREDTQKG